jgi:hypothetical protein
VLTVFLITINSSDWIVLIVTEIRRKDILGLWRPSKIDKHCISTGEIVVNRNKNVEDGVENSDVVCKLVRLGEHLDLI